MKRLNCDWVAEKRERCTESGILMEEFEESEDLEDSRELEASEGLEELEQSKEPEDL